LSIYSSTQSAKPTTFFTSLNNGKRDKR